MIVDCAVYEDGRRRAGSIPLEDAYEAGRDGAFVWIGLHEPTPDEFGSVQREFGLHELAVEDALKAHQRPKLERYGDTLFMVLKTARYIDEREEVEFGEILLFVGGGFVVSVRHGGASELSGMRRSLEERPEMLRCGPGAVLHGIVDRVVDDYLPVVRGLENDIQEVETQVFSEERSNPAERIYKLKREVLEFHRAAAPLALPLDQLAGHAPQPVSAALSEYFRDVEDHLQRITERVEAFRELLNSILTVNLTHVGVRQNEDMRKISGWVAIAAAPTVMAGIYGMNFERMPELSWTYGYPMILGVMACVCTGLYFFFRHRGWL